MAAASEHAGPDVRKPLLLSVELAQKINDGIRTLSYLLHPPLLDEFGIASALKWYIEGLSKRGQIAVTVDVPAALSRFGLEKETALFRIVQECLTNVIRHSGSKTATVRLTSAGDQVRVSVEDEGKGIDRQSLARLGAKGSVGVGIPGLRERLRQFGGKLEIVSGQQRSETHSYRRRSRTHAPRHSRPYQ